MKTLALFLLLAMDADAAIVGMVPFDSGAILRLHDTPSVCVSGALLAEYVMPGKPTIPGCWMIRGGMIGLAFLDGESASLPATMVRKPDTV